MKLPFYAKKVASIARWSSGCFNRASRLAFAMDFLIESLITWIVRMLKKRRRLNLEREALDWPRTLGSVVSTQTRSDKGNSSSNFWSVELTYSYTATGGYYSGTHLLPPESEDETAEVALRWKNKNLVVRYSPKDVSKSVVLMHEQTTASISDLKQDPSTTVQTRG
jgi:hypothetical protein